MKERARRVIVGRNDETLPITMLGFFFFVFFVLFFGLPHALSLETGATPSLLVGNLCEFFFPRCRAVVACTQVSGGFGSGKLQGLRGHVSFRQAWRRKDDGGSLSARHWVRTWDPKRTNR